MDNLKATKAVTKLIVGLGASKITHTIIKNNVQPTTVIDKITVAAASVVLGSMVATRSQEHTEKKIDEFVASWNEFKETERVTIKP